MLNMYHDRSSQNDQEMKKRLKVSARNTTNSTWVRLEISNI